MRFTLHLLLAASGLVGPYSIAFGSERSERWTVRDEETIQRSLTLSGTPMRLIVDNLDGYVHVTGTAGPQVQLRAHKLIRAETANDLEDAKKEVKLDISEKPGSVSIYYDAPWRCNGGDRGCHSGRRFYSVTFDIDLEIPRESRPVLSTVNGDIRLDKTLGDFDVNDVNGGIRMSEISGSGDAHTVNGPVAVQFAKNPSAPTSIKTVNGMVDVYFQPGLSADMLLKTFNGQIYTDFDVTARPAPAAQTEQRNGKFVYHSNRFRAARVGSGGPELSFDAFNGDIRLHNTARGTESR